MNEWSLLQASFLLFLSGALLSLLASTISKPACIHISGGMGVLACLLACTPLLKQPSIKNRG